MSNAFKSTANGVEGVEVETGDGHTLVSQRVNGVMKYVQPTRGAAPEVAGQLISAQTQLAQSLLMLSDAGVPVRGEASLFTDSYEVPAGGIKLVDGSQSIVLTGLGTDDAHVEVYSPFYQAWGAARIPVYADVRAAVDEGMWQDALNSATISNSSLRWDEGEFMVDELVVFEKYGATYSRMFVGEMESDDKSILDYNHNTGELALRDQNLRNLNDELRLAVIQADFCKVNDLGSFFRANLAEAQRQSGMEGPSAAYAASKLEGERLLVQRHQERSVQRSADQPLKGGDFYGTTIHQLPQEITRVERGEQLPVPDATAAPRRSFLDRVLGRTLIITGPLSEAELSDPHFGRRRR